MELYLCVCVGAVFGVWMCGGDYELWPMAMIQLWDVGLHLNDDFARLVELGPPDTVGPRVGRR